MEKNNVIKSNSVNDINMNKSQDLSKNLNIFKQHYYPKVENNPFIFKETKIKKKKKEVPKPEEQYLEVDFSGKINPVKLNLEEIENLKRNKHSLSNAIKRMISYNSLKKTLNIEIPKEFPQIIPENIYKSINEIEPEIQKLDEFSILLTLRFMKSTIESFYNYSKICFVIAIDNSRAINIYDKLINLLISISLCRCFYYLEIPFAIVIFSDYIYQFVIKDFKEKFSIQKIYDSIIVERYFTRIFDVCYYIQKKLSFQMNVKIE